MYYPFKSDLFALKNAWYVAAFSREVTREILARTILDEPVILFRTQAGSPVAMGGRCPHRHFPLGASRLEGDEVVCGYHGIRFGTDGRCTKVPTQQNTPASLCNRSYPVAERYQHIWIWTGDPAQADEALIPDCPELRMLDDPDIASATVHYEHVKGRYLLMHDNLLDLSHLSYLHADSIGTPEFAETPEALESGPGWTKCTRHVQDKQTHIRIGDADPLDPHATYTGPSKRISSMKFFMPSIHVGYDGVELPREAGGGRLREAHVYHAVTPGTRSTTHYFFSQVLLKTTSDPHEVLRALAVAVVPVLKEDAFATEAIENTLQAYGDRLPPEMLTKGDVNMVRARRMLEELIAAEQEETRPILFAESTGS